MSVSTPRERERDNARSQQYQVIRVVGEGAYGMVLKCRNRATGDIVAIKKFRGNYDDMNLRRGMQREVKMLKMLRRHPNIIRMYEAFKRKGRLHVAFEFLPRNLLDVLQQNTGGLKLSLVKYYMCQLAAALKYCHSLNIVHRDIKPENILLDDDHRLKLCDFGFARVIAQDGEKMTDYVATRWYRPPELVLGFKQYDGSVDVWALACILGELLDGQPLFPGENDVDQLHIIQSCSGRMTREQLRRFFTDRRFSDIRVMPGTNPNNSLADRYGELLPAAGVNFMERCLKMDPAERPSSASCYDDPFFDDVRDSLKAADEAFYASLKEAELGRYSACDTPRTPTTPADAHGASSLLTPMRRLSLTSNPNSPAATPPMSPVHRPTEEETRGAARRLSDTSEALLSRQSSDAATSTPTTERSSGSSSRGRSPQITAAPVNGRSRTKPSELSPKPKASVKPVSVPPAVARTSSGKGKRDSTPQKQRLPKISPSHSRKAPVATPMPPPVGVPAYKSKHNDREAMPATPTVQTRAHEHTQPVRTVAENRIPSKKSHKPESIPDPNSPLPPAFAISVAMAAARRASRTTLFDRHMAAAGTFELPIELLIAEPKGCPRAAAADEVPVPPQVVPEAPVLATDAQPRVDELTTSAAAQVPTHRRRSTYLAEGKATTPRVRSSHRPTKLSFQPKTHRSKSDDFSVFLRAAAAAGEQSPLVTPTEEWELLDDEAFETEDDVFERLHRHTSSFGSSNSNNNSNNTSSHGSTLPNWQEISPTAALLRTRCGLYGLPRQTLLKASHPPQSHPHHKSRASVGNFSDFQSFFANNASAVLGDDANGVNDGMEELHNIASYVPNMPTFQSPASKVPQRSKLDPDALGKPHGFLSPQPSTGARNPRPPMQRTNSMPRHALRSKPSLAETNSPQSVRGDPAPPADPARA